MPSQPKLTTWLRRHKWRPYIQISRCPSIYETHQKDFVVLFATVFQWLRQLDLLETPCEMYNTVLCGTIILYILNNITKINLRTSICCGLVYSRFQHGRRDEPSFSRCVYNSVAKEGWKTSLTWNTQQIWSQSGQSKNCLEIGESSTKEQVR